MQKTETGDCQQIIQHQTRETEHEESESVRKSEGKQGQRMEGLD